MVTSTSVRPVRRTLRRRLAAAGALLGLAAGALTAGSVPAGADDAHTTCAATQTVFAIESTGALQVYRFDDLSSTVSPVLAGPAAVRGSGWSQFAKVLGGPDGWVYAIKSTGTFAYHFTGTGFDVIARPLGSAFNSFATATRRNRITVDARGDFFAIMDDGTLRRYELDKVTNKLTYQPLGTGWQMFNSITAAGDGVIYARTAAGALHRYQFEKTSDRYLYRVQLHASGWERYTKGVLSVGADILLGIEAGGRMLHHRYKGEPDPAWLITSRLIGTGWQRFTDVFATSNSCRLTADYAPPAPVVPADNNAPLAVLQNNAESLEYAYTDSSGQPFWGQQPSPGSNQVVWTPLGEGAYRGTPAMVQRSDGRLEFVLHHTNSRLISRLQSTDGPALLDPPVDRAGVMASGATAVRVPATNLVTLFAVDSAGALWRKSQHTDGLYLPWSRQAGPAVVGAPTHAPGPDGTVTIFVRDTAGTFHAASFDGRRLSAFSSLGGTGFTGRAAVVRYPGDLLRVVARDGNGRIRTQKQTTTGVFPGVWENVGPEGTAWPGSPAAVLAPASGRVGIVVRGGDGRIYFAQESEQASASWPEWKPVDLPAGPYISDPTAYTYTVNEVPTWAFAVYNQDYQVWVVTPRAADSKTVAKARGGKPVPQPAFTVRKLPGPKR